MISNLHEICTLSIATRTSKSGIIWISQHFFVLYKNGEAVGYARINLGRPPERYFADKKAMELMRIYFLEEFHGQGLANELMEYCFNF